MEFKGKAVATVICRLRKERGQSQEVLSGLAVMARSHLSMVETGDMLPTLPTLWRLAKALDMKPYELVKLMEEEMERADASVREGEK